MATFIIRNLPNEIHRALKVRAAEHGRSLEAEVRIVLEANIHDACESGLGTRLGSIGKKLDDYEFHMVLSASAEPNQGSARSK